VLAVSGRSEPPPDGTTVASLVNVSEASRSQRLLRNTYRRDDTRLEQLPKLRYAALEALAVGTHFSRHLVLIDSETADRKLNQLADRNSLREFSVLHFAAHTLTDNAPERCALALGNGASSADPDDGLVEVDDIMLGWELDAELLTLSGCETLRAAGAGRGEPLGFTPALFASGARRVLSSVWTVDDRATTMLMDRFYENLARGATPAGALHEAKVYIRTLKDASGRRPFEHPAYWAGFLLVGLP
jgi:CHAT domain-containing protein